MIHRGKARGIKFFFKKAFVKALFGFPATQVHLSINYSFTRLMSIKFLVVYNFLINKLLTEGNSRVPLTGTRKIRNSFSEKNALIIANGPSSKEINWSVVNQERKLGNCFLFLINHSLNDPEVRSRGADFLVLSDPGSHPQSTDPRTTELWQNISTLPELRLITPLSWHCELGDIHCETLDCMHFSDLSLESVTKSTSPLKPRGYPSLTAYKALAYAKHLGFKNILIAGIDNSMFRTVQVDANNSIIQASNHFVQNYGPTSNVTGLYPNGMADYFAEVSEMFLSLKRCFSNVQIYNLGLTSEVDAFPKPGKSSPLYRYISPKQ